MLKDRLESINVKLTLFFKKDFVIYLREGACEKARTRTGQGAEGEGEPGSLLISEPDLGLDPKTPRS